MLRWALKNIYWLWAKTLSQIYADTNSPNEVRKHNQIIKYVIFGVKSKHLRLQNDLIFQTHDMHVCVCVRTHHIKKS